MTPLRLQQLLMLLVCVTSGCNTPNVLDELDLPSATERWRAIEARAARRGPAFDLGLSLMRQDDPASENRRQALRLTMELGLDVNWESTLAGIVSDPNHVVRELVLAGHQRSRGPAAPGELMKWLMVCAHNLAWARVTSCHELLVALASRPHEALALVTSDQFQIGEPDEPMMLVLIALLDEVLLREPKLVDDPVLSAWLDRHNALFDAACATGPVNETRTRWSSTRRWAPWRRR